MQNSTIPLGRTPVTTAGPLRRLAGLFRAKRADHVVHGVKTLISALLAWGIAAPWSPDGRPYVAVATALLMVNASTVYQSVTKAAQSVVARVAGLVLALAAARLLGPTAGAVAVIAVIAVLAGPRRTADDRLQIASTAVIALAANATDPMGSLVSPALQTITGAAVGIAVNALVLPPLYLNESDSAVRDLGRSLGTLLHDMGTGLSRRQLTPKAHNWLHRARSLDELLVRAEEEVQRADESLRWNTRCVAHRWRKETTSNDTFRALRGVSIQVRGIARTLADNAHDNHADHHLGHQFLDRYAETLQLAGAAVQAFAESGPATDSPDASPRERLRGAIDGTLAWHDTMTDMITLGTLTKPGAWHVYGSLMTDAERLLADLDQSPRARARELRGSESGHPVTRVPRPTDEAGPGTGYNGSDQLW
ncbi:aromatic acid exporter family protein [Streptomyces sp. NPDC046727]|uniref:aromatic acid exporter family protein n=1 Tax=Streptomyces sp. NPDC046727 TaxID=3155373 RepID=UPI0033C6F5B8